MRKNGINLRKWQQKSAQISNLPTVVLGIRLNQHCPQLCAYQDRAQLPNVVTLPQGAQPRRHAQVTNVIALQDNITTRVARLAP